MCSFFGEMDLFIVPVLVQHCVIMLASTLASCFVALADTCTRTPNINSCYFFIQHELE